MRIDWSNRAVKEMRKIDAPQRRRIVAKIEQLAADPASLANMTTQLVGSDYSRLRVGDYRVIYSIEGNETIFVLHVRHRREAYD